MAAFNELEIKKPTIVKLRNKAIVDRLKSHAYLTTVFIYYKTL